MKKSNISVGVFVAVAVLLFGIGLFLIGDQHKAFRRKTDFYVEFANLEGIPRGAKVRVNGMDGGQVEEVVIPSNPTHKFRLKLTVDDRLHGLIRNDSIVSIETEGLVGDKFLLIGRGSEQSPEAAAGATLPSKEPFELGKMLEQANGLLKQVGGTITDVQGKLDATLNTANTTLMNTNGVVTDIRRGKGTAGLLLEDRTTAAQVQQVVMNTRQATANLNSASAQVNGLLQDVQQRKLIAKVDDTINNAKSAAQQLEQASQQVNSTLKTAFEQDQYGQDAGTNLQQSLANVNVATGNLADDTEALKHEFFFKGFFKKRGYDSLEQLPIEPYRSGKLLNSPQSRQWIAASSLFQRSADGVETLSPAGQAQIDEAISHIPGLYDSALVVEGYAGAGTAGEKLFQSRQRAIMVRTYLQVRYKVGPKNTGVIGLSSTPPAMAERSSWDGICLVHLIKR